MPDGDGDGGGGAHGAKKFGNFEPEERERFDVDDVGSAAATTTHLLLQVNRERHRSTSREKVCKVSIFLEDRGGGGRIGEKNPHWIGGNGTHNICFFLFDREESQTLAKEM